MFRRSSTQDSIDDTERSVANPPPARRKARLPVDSSRFSSNGSTRSDSGTRSGNRAPKLSPLQSHRSSKDGASPTNHRIDMMNGGDAFLNDGLEEERQAPMLSSTDLDVEFAGLIASMNLRPEHSFQSGLEETWKDIFENDQRERRQHSEFANLVLRDVD